MTACGVRDSFPPSILRETPHPALSPMGEGSRRSLSQHRQTWFTSFRRFLSRGTYVRDWLSRIRQEREPVVSRRRSGQPLAAAILEGTLSENCSGALAAPGWPRSSEYRATLIVLAYQGLLEDGYLTARERSGYYVSNRTLAASPQYKLPLPQPRLAPGKACQRPFSIVV